MSKTQWEQLGIKAGWIKMASKFMVVDSGFNRENYPDLIGQILSDPPPYAQVREINDTSKFKSLNDAEVEFPSLAYGPTEIWYWKSEFSRDLLFGDFKMVDPNNLPFTHVLMGTVKETDPEKIFSFLNSWSQHGQASELIEKSGTGHTSMSVGDVIVVNGKALIVDRTGFKDIST